MQKTVDSPEITIRLQYLLVKWKGVITAIVALCAILAILSGIVWIISRKNSLGRPDPGKGNYCNWRVKKRWSLCEICVTNCFAEHRLACAKFNQTLTRP